MTESRRVVVADIEERLTALETWADGVLTTWDSYAATHGLHVNFHDCRAAWTEVRDGVRALCTKVRTRTDDSGWMGRLENDAAVWTRAASRVDDASDAVVSARLRATGSWTEGASDRYREAIPGQRLALDHAHDGLAWVAAGCTEAVAAGLRHLTTVRDALDALVLPSSFEPYGLTTYSTSTTLCTFSHYSDLQVGSAGRTPLETAETAVSTAWSTLRDEVAAAFTSVDPDIPPSIQAPPKPIAEAYEDRPWPAVGA